jgi:multiple sugar transport system substrate-binding protein
MFTKKRLLGGLALATGAAIALTGCSGGSSAPASGEAQEFDPDEKVTLNLAFWGDETRAGMYNEAIEAFNEEYPNITVNPSFLDFAGFWEKRQTEAAGGGLPDVMQFDYSYLRQYGENNLLLDLGPYLGEEIATDAIPESAVDIGVVGGKTVGLPTSTNAWALFQNVNLADELGVGTFPDGGTYDEFEQWISDATAAGGGETWGAGEFTGIIQFFELYQRSNGKDLFTEDGQPNFTEEELADFWKLGEAVRGGEGITTPEAMEFDPVGAFASGKLAAEMTWDNFGAGYLAQLPEGYQDLEITAPPVWVEGAKDLYLKPSMLHTISAKTEHPAAAAVLVDFLINSPEVGAIFGTNRGLPVSQTQLDGADLDELSTQVRDYEASIADRLGDAPPVPIKAYGSLEQQFRSLGEELGYGTKTPEDAAAEFFTEMEAAL